MKIIELGENPRENGRKLGRAFYAYLNAVNDEYASKLNNTKIYEDVRRGRLLLEKEMPELAEELYGKAETSGLRYEVILLMAMPEILRKTSGCTTIIKKNPNGTISFSHNEDEGSLEFRADNTALLKYRLKDKTVYGYTNACKTIGSCFGFRSDGLLISCNNLMSDEVAEDCLSRYLLGAKLYFSDSYEDAVNIVINMKPASSFHVNLLDTVKHRACSIEKDIDSYTLTELDDVLVHSNHFLHKKGKTDADSLFRYHKACELLKETDDLRTILSYTSSEPDQTIRFTDPKRTGRPMTVANMTFDPEAGMVIIRDENDGSEQAFPSLRR